jgi:hypothetical protein
VAEREARGMASVWRFTPASLRRALDQGSTAPELERDLEAVASSELPQPLRYLIEDTARRHGLLQVTPVACCVTSRDEALLAEVAASRRLAGLKPRLLAPTVCSSALPVADTLELLRAEGYAPVEQDAAGTLVLERPARPRAGAARRRRGAPAPDRRPGMTTGPGPQLPDPELVAKHLLAAPVPAGPVSADPAEPTGAEAVISRYADRLPATDIRWLAHAVEEGVPVRIAYVSGSGGHTQRVVSDLHLEPPYLTGWCHLREDERMFSLSRIRAVDPVSP